jgi:hypothetical protein
VILFVFLACKKEDVPIVEDDPGINNICTYDNLEGSYLMYTDTDTSEQRMEISLDSVEFTTNGISGSGFWYPGASLSGVLDECAITINAYENVMKQGLPSPGGIPRYYYASMNGFGHYFPEKDSIYLYINYSRTGFIELDFSGSVYLKKAE